MVRFGIFLFIPFGLAVAENIDSIAVDSVKVPVSTPVVKYQAIKGESNISYFLKHPLHEVEGSTKLFDCTVEMGPDTLKSKITVKVSVAAFNSGNSNRDSHTLEILDAFKYPFVEFVSDSVRHDGKDFRVFGQLNFHGVKKPINFPVRWLQKDGKTQVEAEFKVNLTDHNVKRPSLLMIPTENVMRIKVHVVAKNP